MEFSKSTSEQSFQNGNVWKTFRRKRLKNVWHSETFRKRCPRKTFRKRCWQHVLVCEVAVDEVLHCGACASHRGRGRQTWPKTSKKRPRTLRKRWAQGRATDNCIEPLTNCASPTWIDVDVRRQKRLKKRCERKRYGNVFDEKAKKNAYGKRFGNGVSIAPETLQKRVSENV